MKLVGRRGREQQSGHDYGVAIGNKYLVYNP